MVLAASDMTGWWIGYAIGALVVVIVVMLVVTLIVTARRIAAVAEDATRALASARERTEALWQIEATNRVASEILDGATRARIAVGGGEDGRDPDSEATDSQRSELHSLPTGPQIDPKLGA